jgi:hypothetical protein
LSGMANRLAPELLVLLDKSGRHVQGAVGVGQRRFF